MKKSNIILSSISIIMLIILFFTKLLLPAKISLIVLNILLFIIININIKLEYVKNIMLIALFAIIFILYGFSKKDYIAYENPILFEKQYNTSKCTFNNYEQTFTIDGKEESPTFATSASVDWDKYKKGIKHAVINTTTIGNNLFSDCNALVDVKANEKIVAIGNNAFKNCQKLSSFNTEDKFTIRIPQSTLIIGENAFYGCSRVQFVYLDKQITKILDNAFNCENITDIY